jgi:hypothetical protein
MKKKRSIAMDGVAMDEFLPKVDQGYDFVPGQMPLGHKEVPMQKAMSITVTLLMKGGITTMSNLLRKRAAF